MLCMSVYLLTFKGCRLYEEGGGDINLAGGLGVVLFILLLHNIYIDKCPNMSSPLSDGHTFINDDNKSNRKIAMLLMMHIDHNKYTINI